jgi:protein TonB
MAPSGAQTSPVIPLLIALLATATTPDGPSSKTGDVRMVFSYEDYPADAMQHGWQGSVQVDLRIDAKGQPRSCRIVRSSGHQSLDLATCNIMLLRARFTPAKDSNGKPVEDVFHAPPIVWRLVEEPAPTPELPTQ